NSPPRFSSVSCFETPNTLRYCRTKVAELRHGDKLIKFWNLKYAIIDMISKLIDKIINPNCKLFLVPSSVVSLTQNRGVIMLGVVAIIRYTHLYIKPGSNRIKTINFVASPRITI
ncbi:MAG: hypothetical protein LW696_07835, partial [Alphaproteobacteria bacterium]|nr:hypothetical protein [Alphaproteobacteria bacterium]